MLTESVPQREQSEKPKPRCADEAWDTRKGFDTFGNGRVLGSMSSTGAVSEPAQNRGSMAEVKVRPRKPPFSKGGSSLNVPMKRSSSPKLLELFRHRDDSQFSSHQSRAPASESPPRKQPVLHRATQNATVRARRRGCRCGAGMA